MTEQIEKTAAFVRRKLADERGGVCHGDRHDAVAVGFYLAFSRRLKKQLEASVWGAAAPASGGMGNVQAGTFLELAGRM